MSERACSTSVCFRISFKLIQICVGRRMAQFAAHSDHLAFVMEGMGQNVVDDECRSADGGASIGEMKFRFSTELLIRQARQVRSSLPADFLLEESGVRDGRIFG
jgi:hypothetical protein